MKIKEYTPIEVLEDIFKNKKIFLKKGEIFYFRHETKKFFEGLITRGKETIVVKIKKKFCKLK